MGRYDEALLRQVAARLVKPRGHWPAGELIERCVAAVGNAALIDRRCQEVEPPARRLLALVGHSRQPRWYVGNLVELLAALGHADGLRPVLALLEAGLLTPALGDTSIHNFEGWLGQTPPSRLCVVAHPHVTARVLAEDLGLPACPGAETPRTKGGPSPVQEADGLEWLLRLAIVWQQVVGAPARRTQQGDFFKRDLERLQGDPLLNGAAADSLGEVPDAGLLAVALAVQEGLVTATDGELRAGEFPGAWAEGLPTALASLWAALPQLESWNMEQGWSPGTRVGNPYPSAYLLALLLLTRLDEGDWARPAAVAEWVVGHHPCWAATRAAELAGGKKACKSSKDQPAADAANALATFLLGFAYPLRLLQATRGQDGARLIRLSPLGRWLLGFGEFPQAPAVYPQTLLVQPNLEILVYRQGLTPELIGRLTRFAAWTGLGSACTLQLQPATVYRALESGETFTSILQTLERHGMKATPAPVVDALRTWADKRERITVYASAALFEFLTPEDLSAALARGLPAVRLSDRLAVVPNESEVDFRHFRLTATRDYGLPPEKCVDVEPDGVTLSIDLARSDLLLDTEVQRFAEAVDRGGVNGRRYYRLTPSSLAAGRDNGVSLPTLESWFAQRTGRPLSPAARLLLTAEQAPAPKLKRLLVLDMPTPELADGLRQWPGTRSLIQGPLGPTALVVQEEHLPLLQERLQALGMTVRLEEDI
jgi:hypothetical protein